MTFGPEGEELAEDTAGGTDCWGYMGVFGTLLGFVGLLIIMLLCL
jgi:hypothetical protein